MKYDFTKVKKAMATGGWKLHPLAKEIRRQTGRKIDPSTIAKALKRGTADPDTAVALVATLGLTLEDIYHEEAA